MKTKNVQGRKCAGIEHNVDLSHPAGRRVRIRELIQLHDSITVGEIIQDMDRSVETSRTEIIGTISELDRAGFLFLLDAADPMDREVRLA
jgi:hypothetical protein